MQQLLDMIMQVTGAAVPVEDAPRRAGDPARLVADATQAKKILGWQPCYAELETIIRHAWQWEQHRSPL